MKVILIQDLEGKGLFGDIIEVKDGYANNYLIPRGIAIPATPSNIKHINTIRQHKAKKLQKEKEEALKLKEQLKDVIIEIKKQVGEKGKLFGSVTPADVVSALNEKGFKIDKKRVYITSRIRQVGTYEVILRLHPEVSVTIKIIVNPEETG